MYEITFEYRDALSHWEWRQQSCVVSSIEKCIEIYGLGVDCDYRFLFIVKVG